MGVVRRLGGRGLALCVSATMAMGGLPRSPSRRRSSAAGRATRSRAHRAGARHPAKGHSPDQQWRDLGPRGHRQPRDHRWKLLVADQHHGEPRNREPASPRGLQPRHRPGRHHLPPDFGGGGVTAVEATPDGTKLFVAGTLQHGQRRRPSARSPRINPTTGAPVTGFTANAERAGRRRGRDQHHRLRRRPLHQDQQRRPRSAWPRSTPPPARSTPASSTT